MYANRRNSRVLKEIGVEEHVGDVRFSTGSGHIALSFMRHASGHNYRNSSFINCGRGYGADTTFHRTYFQLHLILILFFIEIQQHLDRPFYGQLKKIVDRYEVWTASRDSVEVRADASMPDDGPPADRSPTMGHRRCRKLYLHSCARCAAGSRDAGEPAAPVASSPFLPSFDRCIIALPSANCRTLGGASAASQSASSTRKLSSNGVRLPARRLNYRSAATRGAPTSYFQSLSDTVGTYHRSFKRSRLLGSTPFLEQTLSEKSGCAPYQVSGAGDISEHLFNVICLWSAVSSRILVQLILRYNYANFRRLVALAFPESLIWA